MKQKIVTKLLSAKILVFLFGIAASFWLLALLFVTSNAQQVLVASPSPVVQSQTFKSNALVAAARAQIGKVVHYDGTYYQGGFPPDDRGVCTDVIDRALRVNGYDLKMQLDADMRAYPHRYPMPYDANINFRRVRNVQVYLEHHAESLPITTDKAALDQWLPGDIVTYAQIPGSLWHIAIVSDKKNEQGMPYIIHNYNRGTVEDMVLTDWPAPITGHYRIGQL